MSDDMNAAQLSAVRLTIARLFTDRPFKQNGGALRRAVTALFPDIAPLHHHSPDGKPDYSLPPVRYIVIDNIPHLVGLGQGRRMVTLVAPVLTRLVAGTSSYKVTGCDFIEDGVMLGVAERLSTYTSRSLWLALNQSNAQRFKRLGSDKERCRLLENILVGNFLSLAKGLGINIANRVLVKLTGFDHKPVRTPHPMLGFRIGYVSNMVLPEFLGLGKMVSKGFGLMRKSQQGRLRCS